MILTAIGNVLRTLGAMVAIVLLCIGAAIIYGICHDQITARVCIEYFSVFHSTKVLPPGMNSDSPTQQGFFWGVFATWWMGLFIGIPLSIVARIGTARPLPVRALLRPIGVLLGTMAICAFLAGLVGYVLSADSQQMMTHFPRIARRIPQSHQRGFLADYFAHNASYLIGAAGGFVLMLYSATQRWKQSTVTIDATEHR